MQPFGILRWSRCECKGNSRLGARESHSRRSHPQWVALKDIPERFIHFVWASEDQQFFEHHGFDIRRIREAIEEAQDRNDEPRGVSTITMQCARTLFLWQGRSYLRKALEAYYTLWMELLMSKQRILELYLNHIEFGPGIYGIGAAARKYFDTTPDQLSRSQMLALAAILPNPLKWSPTHPDKAVVRKIRRVERLAAQAPVPQRGITAQITTLATVACPT